MAQQGDKIYLKRLKRRRILERRMRCHGNKEHCMKTHALRGKKRTTVLPRMPIKYTPATEAKPKKPSFIKRLFTRQKTA